MLSVAGAVGALYGPLHGGANEAVLRMLERIGHVDNIPKFIDGVKNRKEKMFGFGHRSGTPKVQHAEIEAVSKLVWSQNIQRRCCDLNAKPQATKFVCATKYAEHTLVSKVNAGLQTCFQYTPACDKYTSLLACCDHL